MPSAPSAPSRPSTRGNEPSPRPPRPGRGRRMWYVACSWFWVHNAMPDFSRTRIEAGLSRSTLAVTVRTLSSWKMSATMAWTASVAYPRRCLEGTMPYPISTSPSCGGPKNPAPPTTVPVSRSTTRRCPNRRASSPAGRPLRTSNPAMTWSPSAGKSAAQSDRRWPFSTANTSSAVTGLRTSRAVTMSLIDTAVAFSAPRPRRPGDRPARPGIPDRSHSARYGSRGPRPDGAPRPA